VATRSIAGSFANPTTPSLSSASRPDHSLPPWPRDLTSPTTAKVALDDLTHDPVGLLRPINHRLRGRLIL